MINSERGLVMDNYVITIARGFGSGGKEIATKLGEILGIPMYERQLLVLASDKSGIDESLFVETDEKLRSNKLAKLLKRIPTENVVEPHEKAFISDTNLFNIQAQIIKELAKTQSCIIVGKCADYVLKDFDNVISIYIEAPRAACVKSIMSKMYISEEKAHQLIKKTDKYRADYYKFYTGGNYWTNPVNYDMTLNSDRVGRDKCVDVIVDYIRTKFGDKFIV